MRERSRLEQWRIELERELDKITATGPAAMLRGYERQAELETTLAEVEVALAQHDAANATREAMHQAANQTIATRKAMRDAAAAIADAQVAVAEATREATSAQIANTRAVEDQTAQRATEQINREDADFWFRRYFTSIGVANGLILAALVTGTLDAQSVTVVAAATRGPMSTFAAGATMAVLIPLILYGRARVPEKSLWRSRISGLAWSVAIASTLTLAFGLQDLSEVFMTVHARATAVAAAPPLTSISTSASQPHPLPAPPNARGRPRSELRLTGAASSKPPA